MLLLSKLNAAPPPVADWLSSVAWTSVTLAGCGVAKLTWLLAALSAIRTVVLEAADDTLTCGSTTRRVAPDGSKNMPSAR